MRTLDRRSAIAFGGAAMAAPLASRAVRAQTPAAGAAEQRFRERGIELPKVMAPFANRVPHVRTGNLVFLAGTGPVRPDGTFATGKVGEDVTAEEAYSHARLTGLLLLAMLRAAAGSLDNVARAVKVFGDRGRHARSAVGMPSLPFNISVQIEAVFEVA